MQVFFEKNENNLIFQTYFDYKNAIAMKTFQDVTYRTIYAIIFGLVMFLFYCC